MKFTPPVNKNDCVSLHFTFIVQIVPDKHRMLPLSLRLSEDLDERLERCAKKTKIKKHTLAQLAIEAAVVAIERNGGYLVIPLQFEVLRIPVEKSSQSTIEKQATDIQEAERVRLLNSRLGADSQSSADISETLESPGPSSPEREQAKGPAGESLPRAVDGPKHRGRKSKPSSGNSS